jgi:hypothetical protein
MDLELGHHRRVDFGNPDFVNYTPRASEQKVIAT